jgi:protein O-mannosyl-transferase
MHLSEKNAAVLLIVLCLLGAYSGIGTLGFTNFDDPGYETQNPIVQQGLTARGIMWAASATAQSNWHPLTWISHMLDWQVSGPNPVGHHLTSFLLHFAAALLLFQCLLNLTGAVWRSAAVAIIFAIHPLHVESVAWVAERKDVLSALLCMCAMLYYIRFVRSRRPLHYGLTLLFYALGLTAKPMLVTLPFVFLLLDFWPLGRLDPAASAREKKAVRRPDSGGVVQARKIIALFSEKAPLFALSAVSCVITYLAQRHGGAVVSLERLSLADRAGNALISYVVYIRKAFIPTDLAVFYPRAISPPPLYLLGAGIGLAAITFAVLRWGPRFRYLVTGWFWYLGTLVPVIGLVQVGEQALADRYTYIPLIGLSIVVVWAAADFVRRFNLPRWAAAGLAAALCGAMGWLTWVQVSYWKDSGALFRRAIQVTGHNELAYLDYGASLVDEGSLQAAGELYREYLGKGPASADIHANLGTIYTLEGEREKAIREFKAALDLKPDHAEAHNGMGFELAGEGRLTEAKEHYLAALKKRPDYPEACHNLGCLFLAEGKTESALEQFRKTLTLKPLHAEANEKMGRALAGLNRVEEAIPYFQTAVRIRPENSDYHYYLGMAFLRRQQYDQSLEQLRQVLRLKPDQPDALNVLAWILAARPGASAKDGAEAVGLAEKALRLKGKPDPVIYDTLAAAYASEGKFSEAVQTAEQARSLALAAGDQALVRDIEARAQLYKSGRPYREITP